MEERLNVRSHSLDALQRQGKNYIYSQHAADRQRFRPLGTLQLQTSCYNRFASFRELVAAVLAFNQKLEAWLGGQKPLDNVLYQYNLFMNLSTRLMALRLKVDQQSVLAELEATKKWFYTVLEGDREKQLGNLSSILQVIKNYKQGPVVDGGDNLHMYRDMSRTQHGEFKPPRERLRDFKRKQLITPSTEVDNLMATRNTFFSDKASADQRKTHRNSTVEGESAEKAALTMTNMDTLPASGEKATLQETPQQEAQKQEEPQLGEQADQDFEEESEAPIQTQKKPYTSDALHHKPQQRTLVRTAQPHMLGGQRRLLITQEKEYYQKIEDSKAIEQAKKWSKMKSRQATQLARRAQATQQGNNFKACEFELSRLKKLNNTPRTSEKFLKRKLLLQDSGDDMKTPQQQSAAQSAAQSPSSNQLSTARPISYIEELKRTAPVKLSSSTRLIVTTRPFDATGEGNPLMFLDRARQIEQDIRQTRLTSTINTYSKYIRHTSESTSRRHLPEDQQRSTLRQATLTGLPRSRCSSFGQILYRNRPENYNDEARNMIERIKAAMSSKGVTVPARTLNNSLRVPADPHYNNVQKMYRNGERLISNPWFPKNLGKKKKKKK